MNCYRQKYIANQLTKVDYSRPSYIPSWSSRKKFHRKIRDIEKQIIEAKTNGDWTKVSGLNYILRNSWWGYKKYA